MRLTPDQLRQKRALNESKLAFERKIEEDRLGISRQKQRRVMRFMTYRIIKLVLLGLTALALFTYTRALLPLALLIALMLPVTKRLEREKNKHVNKKYRIKIRATDSVIAIMLLVLTVCMTGYSLVSAYMNGGSLSASSNIKVRLGDSGYDQSQIAAAMRRAGDDNAYDRIIDNAFNLLATNRNVFRQRRMIFRAPPSDFGGADGSMPTIRKRPNIFQMMRNMPIEMVFRQIFSMACSVAVGAMVIAGVVNVIESFKYGEIKRVTVGERFDAATGRNAPCPCGSGKKRKNCCGG